MKKSRFTEEQTLFALQQAEAGQAVGEVCRQMGISEATFYVWKKHYANLGILELRELRQLRDENTRLKRLVADLTLDRHVLQEVIKKRPRRQLTSGARDRTSALRLPASAHPADPRRLAGGLQPGAPAVPAGGAPGAHESAAPQAHRFAPRTGADRDPCRAVPRHGSCA